MENQERGRLIQALNEKINSYDRLDKEINKLYNLLISESRGSNSCINLGYEMPPYSNSNVCVCLINAAGIKSTEMDNNLISERDCASCLSYKRKS